MRNLTYVTRDSDLTIVHLAPLVLLGISVDIIQDSVMIAVLMESRSHQGAPLMVSLSLRRLLVTVG